MHDHPTLHFFPRPPRRTMLWAPLVLLGVAAAAWFVWPILLARALSEGKVLEGVSAGIVLTLLAVIAGWCLLLYPRYEIRQFRIRKQWTLFARVVIADRDIAALAEASFSTKTLRNRVDYDSRSSSGLRWDLLWTWDALWTSPAIRRWWLRMGSPDDDDARLRTMVWYDIWISYQNEHRRFASGLIDDACYAGLLQLQHYAQRHATPLVTDL